MPTEGRSQAQTVALPEPASDGALSVEAALAQRRSVRDYDRGALSLSDVSQLLFAVQGVTSPNGYRAAPSAGALFPLEVVLVAGEVADLAAGIYRYDPGLHSLRQVEDGDQRERLRSVALNQSCVGDAPAVIAIAAVYERTTGKYGARGRQYVHMEVGAAAENAYLQAESLDLGTVFIGAFDDQGVRDVLALADDEEPLCLLPVGRPAGN